jgi:hypothetical protein
VVVRGKPNVYVKIWPINQISDYINNEFRIVFISAGQQNIKSPFI